MLIVHLVDTEIQVRGELALIPVANLPTSLIKMTFSYSLQLSTGNFLSNSCALLHTSEICGKLWCTECVPGRGKQRQRLFTQIMQPITPLQNVWATPMARRAARGLVYRYYNHIPLARNISESISVNNTIIWNGWNNYIAHLSRWGESSEIEGQFS